MCEIRHCFHPVIFLNTAKSPTANMHFVLLGISPKHLYGWFASSPKSHGTSFSRGCSLNKSLACPPPDRFLKITNRTFRYASPCLWNELPCLHRRQSFFSRSLECSSVVQFLFLLIDGDSISSPIRHIHISHWIYMKLMITSWRGKVDGQCLPWLRGDTNTFHRVVKAEDYGNTGVTLS